MEPLQHYGRWGLTHVEPRPAGHAYVRWFRYPLGELRADGQPQRDWDWFCAVEMHGSVLWAFGAKGMPTMDEFRDVLTAAVLLGATTLAFEHRARPHIFTLSKYQPTTIQPMTLHIQPIQLINDETGKVEAEILGAKIYNLDGKEGTETLADVVGGLVKALSGFDAQTGASV